MVGCKCFRNGLLALVYYISAKMMATRRTCLEFWSMFRLVYDAPLLVEGKFVENIFLFFQRLRFCNARRKNRQFADESDLVMHKFSFRPANTEREGRGDRQQKMLSDQKMLRLFAALILVLCLVVKDSTSSSNACCLSLSALNLQDLGMCCYVT